MNEVNTGYMNPSETPCPQYPYPPVPPMPIPPAAVIPVQVVQGPVGIQGPLGPQGVQGPKGESNCSPFKIVIDPKGSSSRLYGLVPDTIGGTYNIVLHNCVFLSEEVQLRTSYEDPLSGTAIPNKAIPLSNLMEIYGGSNLNEITPSTIYEIADNIFTVALPVSTYDLKANEAIKIPSGSLIVYCVRPIREDESCIIEFQQIEDNGRIFNLKRSETAFDELDLLTITEENTNE